MTTNPTTTDNLASTLAANLGDLVTGPDGTAWRFRLEPDGCETGMEYINGMDALGRVAVVEPSSWSVYPQPRPDGFDGAAVKIRTYGGDVYWWQPTLEVWGVPRAEWHADAERRRAEIDQVREILSYGPALAILERVDGTDAYGEPIVRDFTVLGGIEPNPTPEYLAEIARDLMWELTD